MPRRDVSVCPGNARNTQIGGQKRQKERGPTTILPHSNSGAARRRSKGMRSERWRGQSPAFAFFRPATEEQRRSGTMRRKRHDLTQMSEASRKCPFEVVAAAAAAVAANIRVLTLRRTLFLYSSCGRFRKSTGNQTPKVKTSL